MPEILVYTSRFCGFCYAAKSLLKKKGVSFNEIDVTFSPARRQAMTEHANGRTSVPQVFIGDHHVGGFDDLSALDRAGKLDPLLAGEVTG